MKVDKDGWEKNLDKFHHDWFYLRQVMPEHFKRWLRRPWSSHAFVNLFVEAQRAAPYLMGHVDAVLYPLLIFLILL